ncbi:PKD-like domain-containing protein [Algoriphagus aquimarinus]|uniref:beta strand repeat-containing protein n=1 Tax=Algoriphagus aquimarinus TaxID=237018 RepID=UPI0030DB15D7
MGKHLLQSILIFLLISVGWDAYGQTQTLTTTGAGSFTVPAGVTSITVEVWGGGGRGGSKNGSNGAAAGGGGGAYSRSVLTVTPGQTIDYSVGFGAQTTLVGEDSWFLNATTVMAKGGNSAPDNSSVGALGGAVAAGYGSDKFSGGRGADISSGNGGGGGSSAGIAANGNYTIATSNSTGATAPLGGGKGGNGKLGGTAAAGQGRGDNGSDPGGGGGGSVRSSSSGTDLVGGYGGNGQIRISYITLTSAAGTDNQTVCKGDPIINTTYSFPPNSVANPNPTAGTVSISGTPTASFEYTINVTPSYFSTIPLTLTRTGSVTVNPKPFITNMTSTVCNGDAFTATPTNGTNGVVPPGTTYSWNAPTVTGGLTGGAAGSGASNISGTLTNPTNTAQTATYTVTPLTGSCTGNTFTVIVTVSPKPAISNMTNTVCSGDAFNTTPTNGTNGVVPPGTTYSWLAPVVTGGITGGAGGTTASNISGTLTNPTNLAQTAIYTVTPITGICTGPTFTVTVTVNPKPAITNMTRAVCSGDPFTVTPDNGTNGVVPAGTTYSWSTPSVTAGITGGAAGSGINISGTLTNTTNTTQTATYTVTPTSGSCTGSPFTITLTLDPKPIVSNMGTTVCSGDAFNLTPADGTNGVIPSGTTYSWSAPSVSAGITGGSTGSGTSITGTLTNTTNTAQTATYTVIPTSGSCSGSPFTVSITLSPRPAINNFNLSICTGSSFTISPANGSNGIVPAGTTYSWNVPTVTGGITGGTSGNAANNISNTLSNPTDSPQTATYTVTPITGICGGTPFTVIVTVDPITAITSQPSTALDIECFGDGFDPLSVTAVGGGLVYQWYSNTIDSNVGGTPVDGATSASFTPPSTIEGSAWYYVVVTGNCGVETSNASGQFLVTPPVTSILQHPSSTNQIECLGDPFPILTVEAGGEGTVTYQWYSNTTNANTGGTLIPGETDPTFTPPSTLVGTLYYYATASSDCGTVPTKISGAYTVTQPSVVTSEDIGAQEICVDNTFDPISITADGTGTIEYQWYSNTSAVADTLGAEVIELSVEIADSFTPPTTLGTLYYFVKVSSDCGPNVLSSISGAFIVNPLPIPTLISDVDADPVVCENSSITYTTESGQSNYIWEIQGQVQGTDYTISDGGLGTDDNTVTLTWLTEGPKEVSVYYTNANGCTASSPATSSITVDPLPVPTLTSTVDANPEICEGGSITYTTEPGQDNYVWNIQGNEGSDYTLTFSGSTLDESNSIEVVWLTGGSKNVSTYYTSSTTGCTASSPVINTINVNPLPVPTFTESPGTEVCEQSTSTYTTQTDKSNYIWSITGGVSGTDYTITAGGVGSGSSTVTIQWLTTGPRTVTVRYTEPTTGCVASTTATSNTTVQAFATVGPPSVAYPSVCISSPTLTSFTRTTNGVTGIANNGVPGANGLPPGISASFNSSTGVITFSGTVTASSTPRLFNYNIPLTGNCINGLAASGTIDVSPNYVLTSVSAVSATVSEGSAQVRVNGNTATLPNGVYIVTYILDDGIPPAETDSDIKISAPFVIANGTGTFPTIFLTDLDVDVYEVIIKTIKMDTDVCEVPVTDNNIAFFSVCGATFNENGTFTVPAGIYEITIQAFGAGTTGQSGLITIPVTPGKPLGVFIGQSTGTGNARSTYVTRDSSLPDPENSSLIYVTGGGDQGPNGTVNISYSCPDANPGDCIEIIDDGAKSGTTIIRFTCDYIWGIPEGLVEFSVYAVGGGGGGGMGPTGGGGGGGGIASTTFTSTNPYGIPAGNSLNITVGNTFDNKGRGASTANVKGGVGGNSTVTDPSGNINVNLNAQGGGGGGSFNNLDGSNGASGGGGAFSDQAKDTKGNGGSGISGQGNNGGNGGRGNLVNHARSGGGGGGAGQVGEKGSGAGVGLSDAGDGGDGASFTLINGETYGYGAGGGGIGFNENGEANKEGEGGEANDVILGGKAGDGKVGGDGTAYTGSGGGAGTTGGGNGGQGVVYITYFNFRILEVEYLYFEAEYNTENRTGELTWATAQEWENSHFEIERSVNVVTSWTKIGEVNGQGYKDSPTDYSFQDTDLPAAGGNIFYRLKQIDMDESFAYSVTRSIQVKGLKGQSTWIVYPNPSSPGSYVSVDLLDRGSYRDEQILIKISDVKGVFHSYTVRSVEDVSVAVNDYLEQAAPGIHIVQLIWGTNSEQLKIVRR